MSARAPGRLDKRFVGMRVALVASVGLSAALASSSALAAPPAPSADSSLPSIEHEPVRSAVGGEPVKIEAQIEDPDGVFAPAVYVRPKGAPRFVNLRMTRTSTGFEALIPAKSVVEDLEYFVEAFDQLGNGPAQQGSPQRPLLIRVRPPRVGATVLPRLSNRAEREVPVIATTAADDDDSVFGKWWFWTIVGLAAAGAVAGTAIALTGGDDASMVTIDVRGPDPTRGL